MSLLYNKILKITQYVAKLYFLHHFRDRVVERFAMLLSQAAGTSTDDSETDESRVCGSPGKVLDAALLQQLLCEIQPEHQLFYGPSELR
jgi:hypothetical protein